MNLAYHDSGYSTESYLNRLKRRRIVLILLVVLGIASTGAVGSILISRAVSLHARTIVKVPKDIILASWSIRDYDTVIRDCLASLALDPLDSFYLAFKGFAQFHAGLAHPDVEERNRMIDSAIFSLRRSLIGGATALQSEAYYILGKAYYHKGSDYFDDAIHALERSLATGFDALDIREYLALAYYALGLVDQSVGYFTQAVAGAPGSSELLLASAIANFKAGSFGRAEGLALDTVESARDAYLRERAMFLLGDICMATGRLEEALEQYANIKATNPESAEAWYNEGLVFQAMGDPIKARASWRRAITIDPMHAGARQKLAER
jgi:tetratricopeptide (TPR) repeat protein